MVEFQFGRVYGAERRFGQQRDVFARRFWRGTVRPEVSRAHSPGNGLTGTEDGRDATGKTQSTAKKKSTDDERHRDRREQPDSTK